MYTDQTGAFPIQSSQDNLYLMILCEINWIMILVESMEKRSSGEMSNAYKKLMNRLKVTNIYPSKHLLDNERSNNFLQHIKQAGIMYEKELLHIHWCNAAEKVIQTFKNHLIVILSGVNKTFSMHLLDQLLLQTEMTLNMLRATHVKLWVSAYVHLQG